VGVAKQMNDKKLTTFLYSIEGVGAVFVGIFLAAYLGGLFVIPQTTVFHSEPAVRIALAIFGAILLILILASVSLAIYLKDKR
jgi:hypothetical protein